MPTLPSGLKVLATDYSMDDPGGVMRTEVAGGASRFALDWDRGPQRFQVTILCDATQFSVWSAFYHHQIKKGAIAFDMMMDSGFGMSAHLVNIMPGSYAATRTSGIMMVVSFVAETENQAYDMSAADADALIDFYTTYGPYSWALLDRLARFATVEVNALP